MGAQAPLPLAVGRPKVIRATVELGPNYLFHLQAMARAEFDSDYADRHRGSVKEADLGVLEEYRSRLAWADGHLGDLTIPAVFLPAYLGLQSAAALEEYFGLLGRAIEGGEPGPFLRRYAERLARTAHWWEEIDAAWLDARRAPTGLGRALETLGAIYVGNFASYETGVWPAERPGIEAAADRLNGHLAERDVIGQWERLTGLAFRTELYEIVLVSAIKNGPNANSLGYDRNVFYCGSDFDWLTQFISHETGSHILIGLLKDYVRPAPRDTATAQAARAGERAGPGAPAYNFDLVYRAYENLVRFYNILLLGRADVYPMPDHYRGPEFEAVYRRLYAENPRLSPREMLEGGLRESHLWGASSCAGRS